MGYELILNFELPDDLNRLRSPAAVNDRLQTLLDRQDRGETLTEPEHSEAEGLVDLAEFLSLLRLRMTKLAGTNGDQ